MKIAVFGGSFNPVHNGHVAMIKALQRQFCFDKILIIPAGVPPHKSDADYAADRHRLKMCTLAFGEVPQVEVSDMELRADGVSYTYLTLQKLHRQYPDDRLHFICGSDMFFTLQNWREPEIIFSLADICAVPRDGASEDKMKLQKRNLESMGAVVHLCDYIIPPDASSKIRLKLKSGESVAENLPKSVLDYIGDNKVYG